MLDDAYIQEFNELKECYPNYKFIKNTGNEINKEVYEESIIILSGSIFRKNQGIIESILFPCKFYIFDFKSNLHKNLAKDYPYIDLVTNTLQDIKSLINTQASDLSKIIILINFSRI